MVGYLQYRPFASKEKKNNPREGRYFTYLKENRVGVWGLESYYFSQTLFVTEGIFDAARITWLGYSTVAVLSSDVSASTRQWFYLQRAQRKLVAVCDSDNLRLKNLTHHYVQLESGDLGEAPQEYVDNLVKEY